MDQNFSLMAQSRANYYTAGSPVQFVRVELLKGDVTGEVAVCLTFKNVGTEPLTGLVVHFKCKDAAGQVLCEDDFYYESLDVQPGDMGDYTLIMQDGTGAYLETGYTWCSYNYPEEEMYNEAYPPDRYDCFTLCLTMDGNSYEGEQGSLPERYALDEYGERWFLLYYAPETGAVVLEVMDGSGLFGADEFVSFEPLENG